MKAVFYPVIPSDERSEESRGLPFFWRNAAALLLWRRIFFLIWSRPGRNLVFEGSGVGSRRTVAPGGIHKQVGRQLRPQLGQDFLLLQLVLVQAVVQKFGHRQPHQLSLIHISEPTR